MKKFIGIVVMAIAAAVFAASLVIAIEVIRDDRADKLAKQNRKLRQEVAQLNDTVQASNQRINQLERALQEEGIPLPSEGGGTEQTDSSQQPGAAPTKGQTAPQTRTETDTETKSL